MNKLREKLDKAHRGYLTPSNVTKECEQITDDFSVRLLNWIGENVKLLDDKSGYLKSEDRFLSTNELQQYFKENIYGKE